MRRSSMEKISDSKETGAQGVNLSKLDNTVLDIFDRENATFNKWMLRTP